jgi:putative FmdB family regulatory protein
MPTYAYRCDRCGLRFDRVQSFSAGPLKRCPECDGHVRRLIQPAGIVFKGSGWYVTESRKKDKGAFEKPE